MDRDTEYLKMLAIFHYIVGGFSALVSCLFIFHIAFGLAMIIHPDTFANRGANSQQPFPSFLGWMFVVMGSCAVLAGWVLGGFLIYTGRCLARQKKYLFCMIMAGIGCLFVPIGTALGIFTIVALQKPTIRAMFGKPV